MNIKVLNKIPQSSCFVFFFLFGRVHCAGFIYVVNLVNFLDLKKNITRKIRSWKNPISYTDVVKLSVKNT